MSEYLDEEEQMARLRSWWEVNGTSVIVGLLVAVAGIVGWNWYGGYSEERVYDAARVYATYQAAPDADKASRAAELAQNFSGTAYHVFVLLDQAARASEEGEAARSAELLNEAVAVADDPLLGDLARIRLAKAQRESGDAAAALSTLSGVRNEGYRAWALEAKGDIHAAAGDLELAHQTYQAALDSLPEGDERPFLRMKFQNTAPFDGTYVQFTDPLRDALNQAESTLQGAAQSADATSDAAFEATADQAGQPESDGDATEPDTDDSVAPAQAGQDD